MKYITAVIALWAIAWTGAAFAFLDDVVVSILCSIPIVLSGALGIIVGNIMANLRMKSLLEELGYADAKEKESVGE